MNENIVLSYTDLDGKVTQRKFYSQKIKDVNTSYKNFKKEINLYQEFLVNNEYKEHKKKGN